MLLKKIHFVGICRKFSIYSIWIAHNEIQWKCVESRKNSEFSSMAETEKIGFDQHRTMARNRKYYTEQKKERKKSHPLERQLKV